MNSLYARWAINFSVLASATTYSRTSCVMLDVAFSRLHATSTAEFPPNMLIASASSKRLSELVPVAAAVVEAGIASVVKVLVASTAVKSRDFLVVVGYFLHQCVF